MVILLIFFLVFIQIMWSLWELDHSDGWTQHTPRIIFINRRTWAEYLVCLIVFPSLLLSNSVK